MPGSGYSHLGERRQPKGWPDKQTRDRGGVGKPVPTVWTEGVHPSARQDAQGGLFRPYHDRSWSLPQVTAQHPFPPGRV